MNIKIETENDEICNIQENYVLLLWAPIANRCRISYEKKEGSKGREVSEPALKSYVRVLNKRILANPLANIKK